MSNVAKYLFILKKHFIFWNGNSKFKSAINLLSILITTLSLTFIILVLSINNGFKKHIIDKLIDIDGYVHVSDKYYSKPFEGTIFDDNYIYTEIYSIKSLIKSSGYSDGVILNAFDLNGYNVIKLGNYIIDGEYSDGGLIIGNGLAQKLHIKVGDYAYLINVIDEKEFNINNLIVSGIYKTNIPYYDDYSIYINKNHLENFIISDYHNKSFIFNSIDENSNNYNSSFDVLKNNYHIDYWYDRHDKFIKWLFSYDAPINILLIFIFIISLINLISSTYIDIAIRRDENMLLYTLGFDINNIKRLYVFKNSVISFVSILFTLIFLYTFIYINSFYPLIDVPSEIYFTSTIPIEVNYVHFIIFFFYMLFISQLSTFISFKNSLKNNNIIKVDHI